VVSRRRGGPEEAARRRRGTGRAAGSTKIAKHNREEWESGDWAVEMRAAAWASGGIRGLGFLGWGAGR
jgi:hypothetical protein